MNIAEEVSKRSTCDRGFMGCVIVKDKRLLTTGYSGAPAGQPHCDEAGHLMKTVDNGDGHVSQHCVRTNHAEENAIVQAAKFGMSVEGAIIYSNMVPCFTCAKMIINSGIKRVVARYRYHSDGDSVEMFNMSGVQLDVVNDKVLDY